jgi:hypothetical protein
VLNHNEWQGRLHEKKLEARSVAVESSRVSQYLLLTPGMLLQHGIASSREYITEQKQLHMHVTQFSHVDDIDKPHKAVSS